MVGSKTATKLINKNIKTVGELAKSDPNFLIGFLKSHGVLIWNYANGKEDSPVRNQGVPIKGLGNSTTIPFDAKDKSDCLKILLGLTETTCSRLRLSGKCASVVSISLKSSEFEYYSHQRRIPHYTNCTKVILETVQSLFEEVWGGEPIRQMGVQLTELWDSDFHQLSLFDPDPVRYKQLDETIDKIRTKYGKNSIFRSCFLHSGIDPLQGGVVREDDYPMMSSIL